MKKLSLSILASFISLYTFAQADNKVIIGTIDSIQSKMLNEKRKIWVHVPDSDPDSQYSQQRFPVVYLLDGDSHFSSVVGMIEQLSSINENTICPQMIVVGIPNTNRTRDLTPTKDSFDLSSGGGEQFMSFIENELIPYIDSTYPTQPYKMLIGHSFGGLTVMNALINHTKLFNSYVAIDPSMWWNKQKFLKAGEKIIPQENFTGKTLYLGIANTMAKGMNVNDVVKDTTGGTIHIRSILELNKFIKSQKPKGLKYASKYYENDNHSSVPLIVEYDALRFIFEKYRLNLEMNDDTDSSVDIANKYALHYKEVSQLFGYTVKPPEAEVNGIAYQFLKAKQYKKAESFFKMNVANYPESFNAYDSYGDYFVAIGNKPKAIENFKKALSLREYPESREKLNKLLD
ncbi:MAG: alpha/beta hydrolase-fold protein [Ginsengibacter sp.]